jgi:putative membrane protein
MRKLLRTLTLNTVILYITSRIVSGIGFEDIKSLFLASIVLSVINFLVKPLIDLLLLPVNILTLGALGWVANVISLYLVSILVSGFSISSFIFQGFAYKGFIIPEIYFNSLMTTVAASIAISLSSSFLFWLFH